MPHQCQSTVTLTNVTDFGRWSIPILLEPLFDGTEVIVMGGLCSLAGSHFEFFKMRIPARYEVRVEDAFTIEIENFTLALFFKLKLPFESLRFGRESSLAFG